MDMNEMLQQLANNPQMLTQMVQLVQTMQQNGMIPSNLPQQRTSMNWNMPTNPMVAMWMNNMASMMNNMNGQNNSSQPSQNQNTQQPSQQSSQMENVVSSVRVVKTPDEIKADEILMNGNISLFLQDDLNVVYGKRWTNNGTIENMRFVREVDNTQNTTDTEPTRVNVENNLDIEAFLNRVSDLIDGKLDDFKREYSLDKRGSVKTGNNKKGVEEHE